jgi:hypothetical protein
MGAIEYLDGEDILFQITSATSEGGLNNEPQKPCGAWSAGKLRAGQHAL